MIRISISPLELGGSMGTKNSKNEFLFIRSKLTIAKIALEVMKIDCYGRDELTNLSSQFCFKHSRRYILGNKRNFYGLIRIYFSKVTD